LEITVSLLKTLSLSAVLALAAFPSLAETYVRGVIEEVNAETGRLTINHEALIDLDMEAMTMIFRVAEPQMIEGLDVGDTIEFVADRVSGRLTVVALRDPS
jgi:Cu/Ag efflux protein CusF